MDTLHFTQPVGDLRTSQHPIARGAFRLAAEHAASGARYAARPDLISAAGGRAPSTPPTARRQMSPKLSVPSMSGADTGSAACSACTPPAAVPAATRAAAFRRAASGVSWRAERARHSVPPRPFHLAEQKARRARPPRRQCCVEHTHNSPRRADGHPPSLPRRPPRAAAATTSYVLCELALRRRSLNAVLTIAPEASASFSRRTRSSKRSRCSTRCSISIISPTRGAINLQARGVPSGAGNRGRGRSFAVHSQRRARAVAQLLSSGDVEGLDAEQTEHLVERLGDAVQGRVTLPWLDQKQEWRLVQCVVGSSCAGCGAARLRRPRHRVQGWLRRLF